MSIFDELKAHGALPFARARMLPLEAYRSDDVLRRELEILFGRGWQCVGRTADLADPGDHLTAELPVAGPPGATRSVIVLRADDAEVRAFDNVCVHRGAQLLQGCGNASRIVCPYHAWVYRLDGTLVGGPYLNDTTEADGRPFDPTRHRLSSVRTEVGEGFVFVNPEKRSGCVALWFGPQGTVTPLHHDTCNIFFAQVWGEKRITLIPPHHQELFETSTNMYSDRDPELERLCEGQITLDLKAGEALFIPIGWWHHIRALSPSISLAMTHFLRSNQFQWYQPGQVRG